MRIDLRPRPGPAQDRRLSASRRGEIGAEGLLDDDAAPARPRSSCVSPACAEAARRSAPKTLRRRREVEQRIAAVLCSARAPRGALRALVGRRIVEIARQVGGRAGQPPAPVLAAVTSMPWRTSFSAVGERSRAEGVVARSACADADDREALRAAARSRAQVVERGHAAGGVVEVARRRRRSTRQHGSAGGASWPAAPALTACASAHRLSCGLDVAAELVAHRREQLVAEGVLLARAEAGEQRGGEHVGRHRLLDRRLRSSSGLRRNPSTQPVNSLEVGVLGERDGASGRAARRRPRCRAARPRRCRRG